jgi:hypothetical protein
MRRFTLLGVCLALALLASPARAGVMYQYVTDHSTYSGLPGSTVNVNVFLQEIVTPPSSSLLASEAGLYSAGFYAVDFGSPVNHSVITGVNPNPAFMGGFVNSNFNATQARLTEAGFTNTQGVTGTTAGGVTNIFLGSLSVQVGNLPTTFTLEPYKFAPKGFGGTGIDGNTLTWNNNFDLDLTNNGALPPPAYTGADARGFVTFTVSTPEPGTLALAFLAFGGAGSVKIWRRWRNRRRALPGRTARG